jgi:glycosyltransferase involved in cell wall biosynthesis
MAPLEAFACGCATVTSDLPCFNDFLRPGQNGLTFDHTDQSGEALAVPLERLMSSPGLRATLAAQALATARMFTPSAIAEQYLDDFATLLSVEAKG